MEDLILRNNPAGKDKKGFTLVEMLIVLAVLMPIIQLNQWVK